MTEETTETIIHENQYARLFDIEIRNNDQKIEPTGKVSVTVELADMPKDKQDTLKVVHFTEAEAILVKADATSESITFDADSFSVYTVVNLSDLEPQGKYILVSGIAGDPGPNVGYNESWGTDYFTQLLAPLGLRVNYMIDCANYSEMHQASEAVATTTFCHTLGSYLATALEQHFGVPQIDAPQPYGLAGTDAWLRAIAKVVGKEKETEEYIESEHKRIAPKVAELREFYKGVKGFIMTGSAYAHGLLSVLRELGIEVQGSIVFHHDPVYDGAGKHQDSLKEFVDNYGDIEHYSVSKTQAYQLPQVFRRVKTDFVVIRHQGLAPEAAKMGIPALAMGDEHIPVGYEGIIRTGEMLKGILARKKFNQVLNRHVESPYSKWWKQQDDPFLLAKHPEILDTVIK